jgi:hypothetical protein
MSDEDILRSTDRDTIILGLARYALHIAKRYVVRRPLTYEDAQGYALLGLVMLVDKWIQLGRVGNVILYCTVNLRHFIRRSVNEDRLIRIPESSVLRGHMANYGGYEDTSGGITDYSHGLYIYASTELEQKVVKMFGAGIPVGNISTSLKISSSRVEKILKTIAHRVRSCNH